jgi:hypothetical protein
VDQTRGILNWCEDATPGAYHPEVCGWGVGVVDTAVAMGRCGWGGEDVLSMIMQCWGGEDECVQVVHKGPHNARDIGGGVCEGDMAAVLKE